MSPSCLLPPAEVDNVVSIEEHLRMQHQLDALEARLKRRLWQQLQEELGFSRALRLWQDKSFRDQLMEQAFRTVEWEDGDQPIA